MAGMWGITSRSRSTSSVAFAAVVLICCYEHSAGSLTAGDAGKIIKQDWGFWGLAGLPSCKNETFLVR
jgi:hypothetical protein